MPAALLVDWDPIREAAILGVPFKELAREFEIAEMTIRQRSHREKWPLPHKVQAELSKRVKQANKQAKMTPFDLSTASLSAVGEQNRSLVVREGFKFMQQAFRKLKAPSTWKDTATLNGMIEKGSGLDKPMNIQIGIVAPYKARGSEEYL